MREVFFERELRADPNRSLPRLEQWLARRGYQAAARSSLEWSFLGATTAGRHRLTVRADGQAVRFTFAPSAPGVPLPPDAELERQVDEAIASLGETPRAVQAPTPAAPAGATRRCSICATPLEPGVSVCPMCGMTN